MNRRTLPTPSRGLQAGFPNKVRAVTYFLGSLRRPPISRLVAKVLSMMRYSLQVGLLSGIKFIIGVRSRLSQIYVVSDPSVVVTGEVSEGLKTVQKPQQRGRSRK